jgi:glucosamine kinase
MLLLCDSGSSKADWLVFDEEKKKNVANFCTCGFNPIVMGIDAVEEKLYTELLPKLQGINVNKIKFYGAGCTPDICPIIEKVFLKIFPNANDIHVASDLLGAAKALCKNREGVVAILGTGSNSCLFDGVKIVAHTPALGYILGDEGSGAVLGRIFINYLLKGLLPPKISKEFLKKTSLTQTEIISQVYGGKSPNQFLASISPFIKKNRNTKQIKQIVVNNFRDFFTHNISIYNRPDLPVNCVGSIAYHFSEELITAAEIEGFRIGRILQKPIDDLI